MTSPSPPPARSASWLSWLLLLLGTCGFTAIWVVLSLFNDAQNSWMAVLGALDVAWLLRLGRCPGGPRRMALAMAATVAIVAMANWGIIAAQLGAVLGLQPWESAVRLGPNLAWTVFQLANGAIDLAWCVAALVVAAFASR
ncbi:hypothetical protein [Lysobacter niastensis]|uniref:Transmembrane protein n=1 Tax=Lysobacter niastensis TaxID=380629 RepID=A0ABS0BAE1_9GAMM|nr:hypothetical protein [Lysobacter niastensis]MBF6025802.1 hypothetical protein [Lysobacter niastensis]